MSFGPPRVLANDELRSGTAGFLARVSPGDWVHVAWGGYDGVKRAVVGQFVCLRLPSTAHPDLVVRTFEQGVERELEIEGFLDPKVLVLPSAQVADILQNALDLAGISKKLAVIQ